MQVLALTIAILGLHLLALASWTGSVRVMRKVYVNPEDARTLKGDAAEADHADVQRVKRAHQNALENFVPFAAIAYFYAQTNPSKTAAIAYFGTFAAARILHSIFYLWGRQPFRTIVFAIGSLATFGMGVHVIRAAI
jgi:glutathione S-transferase